MDKMLLNLTPYGIDHHSRENKHLISVYIQKGLTSLNGYLTSRVIQTTYLKQIDKATVNEEGLLVEGVSPASLWVCNDQDPEKLALVSEGEREVRVEFIDIAELHCYNNQDSENFFRALAKCQDMSLFEQGAIQKIID